ncbi:hypothetical protein [Pedococcus bigeumensis]|uniref:hypothetical protein n=1 Tax=Pedococcus bigeumensis TaxID=433644 RepID=UPI0031D2C67E
MPNSPERRYHLVLDPLGELDRERQGERFVRRRLLGWPGSVALEEGRVLVGEQGGRDDGADGSAVHHGHAADALHRGG